MIRHLLARALVRLAGWLGRNPGAYTVFSSGSSRSRPPTPGELLAELKSTAWTGASLNAAVCASFPPRLYVRTAGGQPAPRVRTRALSAWEQRRLQQLPHTAGLVRRSERVEEVLDHPLLDLLASVNSYHNAFDIWEITTLSQETHGCAYWLLDPGPLGAPAAIWPLPPHLVTPWREPGGDRLIDAYL